MSELAAAALGQTVHALRRAAREIDVQVEQLDRLEEAAAASRHHSVSMELILGSFDVLAAHHPEPAAFGIWLADRLESKQQPQLVTLVARSSPCLGDALRRYVSLFRELDPDTQTHFSSTAGVTTLNLTRRTGAMPVPHVVGDYALIGLRDILRSADLEPSQPVQFHFARRRPSALASWVERFGENMSFRANTNGVSFPTDCIAAPMRSADPYLSSILLSGDSLVESRNALQVEVRGALDQALSSRSQLLTGVAERLGMSGRTLQRRLHDAGLEFSGLVDSARRRRALSLIRSRKLTVKDLARETGYADVRTFRASFVRWTGMTPREFRRSAQVVDSTKGG